MPDLLFGKYLSFRVAELIENHQVRLNRELLTPRFTLKHREVRKSRCSLRDAKLLDRASLPRVPQELILLLAGLAKDCKIEGFAEVLESPTWGDFFNGQNRILVARDEKTGHQFKGDGSVLHELQERGIEIGFDFVPESEKRGPFENRIRSANALILGSARRNMAAEWFLTSFWGGNSPVRFEHPDQLRRDLKTIVRSRDKKRRLMVTVDNGETTMEEITGTRHLGVLSVVKNPFKEETRTAILAAGCSRKSTHMITDQLFCATPYPFIDAALRLQPQGPALLIFNSSAKPQWSVVGEKASRGGRPRMRDNS